MSRTSRVALTDIAQTPRVAPTEMAHGQHGSAMLKLKSF